jgi:hypothetical protein
MTVLLRLITDLRSPGQAHAGNPFLQNRRFPMLTLALMTLVMLPILVHLASRGLHSTTELSMERHD